MMPVNPQAGMNQIASALGQAPAPQAQMPMAAPMMPGMPGVAPAPMPQAAPAMPQVRPMARPQGVNAGELGQPWNFRFGGQRRG